MGQLKDNHKLLSYSGYLAAATVGVLRIYNKSHLLTEVLAGAGLGIFSTKLTYWVFDKVKYRKKAKFNYRKEKASDGFPTAILYIRQPRSED